MARSESMKRLSELASKHDLSAFEEAWAEALAEGAQDVPALLDAVTALEAQGHIQKAFNYLQLLLPALVEAGGRDEEAFKVLRRMAKLNPRDKKLRGHFTDIFRRMYPDHEGMDDLIRHSRIESDPELLKAANRLHSYLQFRVGCYVQHPAGWGVGIVKSIDYHDATVVIDFDEAKNHEIEMEVACRITRHLDPEGFKAMKHDRIEKLIEMADSDRAALVKMVVVERDRPTTVRDLRDRITDGIVPTKEWSRWWSKARSQLKRDPRVRLGTGVNARIEVTERDLAFEDTILANMRSLPNLPRKIKYMRELFQDTETQPENRHGLVVAAGVLAKSAAEERERFPGAMLSLALMLERVAETVDEYQIPDELKIDSVITDPRAILDALATVPVAADRKAILERIKKRFPDFWPEFLERAFLVGAADVCDVATKELMQLGELERLNRVMELVIDRFREHRGSFLWLAKTVLKGNLPDVLPRPKLTSLFEKILLMHAHCTNLELQTEDLSYRKECRTIEKFLTSKTNDLVRRTLEECSLEEAMNFYSMVRGSRSLPEDVQNSLVAIILRTRPDVAKRRAQDQERANQILDQAPVDEGVLWVTAEGYARFQGEYNKLVNDEIPLNAAEIGKAAEHGDLSENAEWSAAIEKQSLLTRREEEMSQALAKARVIDPATVGCDHVGVGCRVRLTNLDTHEEETYVLLGPWDADMDKRVISYLSPIGRALLDKKQGEAVTVTLPGGTTNFRIDAIEVADEHLGSNYDQAPSAQGS